MIDITKIETARKQRGWLKKDLAKHVGIHPVSLTRILKGQSENPRTIKAICDTLGLSTEEVYISSEKAC